MTRRTALMIKYNGDEIKCEASGPHDNGKYAGWISFWKDGRPHIAPLVSSTPIYDSSTKAVERMQEVVTEIRARDDL